MLELFPQDILERAFEDLVKNERDFGEIINKTAEFEVEPYIDRDKAFEDQSLTLIGTFDTSPTLRFFLSYIIENGEWKLNAFYIQMPPKTTLPLY